CRKAKRVTMSMALFAALAREERIEPSASQLFYKDLIRLLTETATDNELAITPGRLINFKVNEKAFSSLNMQDIRLDPDMLEQALGNILDNAGKYSYARTTV